MSLGQLPALCPFHSKPLQAALPALEEREGGNSAPQSWVNFQDSGKLKNKWAERIGNVSGGGKGCECRAHGIGSGCSQAQFLRFLFCEHLGKFLCKNSSRTDLGLKDFPSLFYIINVNSSPPDNSTRQLYYRTHCTDRLRHRQVRQLDQSPSTSQQVHPGNPPANLSSGTPVPLYMLLSCSSCEKIVAEVQKDPLLWG